MNKANLKSYAPKARLDFIKAVTERANVLGISAAGALPAEVRGDVAIIDGREWPAKVAGQREELLSRIKRHGFAQTMDEVAYTWFNRFAALRYMEIHDYLDHGWRVLSSRDGGLPEILRHASEVSLPGLNAERAREMQLAGNQDNELYKLLLVAQCNELSRVMPFLFERIDDDTELLLPENLLRTDSIVAKLVESVPEEDWQEIEVIGWLYQFYISEKKDQVIGKVVKSEDIPAATQLFTPNWIVQYLVQNSVGRLWLMSNPTSTLASQWPYYIQPAEQTPEVQAQLDALIQTRVREDGETLNPETITVLDPACGSGHILVVTYDVLKAIYLERGYQPRSIPRLILEKNLYGLDIDDRAAQLAAFALLMRARADDRRLFNEPPKLNVLSLQESKDFNAYEIASHVVPFGLQRASIDLLLKTFEEAKTFGSLIQIPVSLIGQLVGIAEGLERALKSGDLYAQQAAKDLLPLVWQAFVLSVRVDAVIANPPYLGTKGTANPLRNFAVRNFPEGKTDLYAQFMLRSIAFLKGTGQSALVTMQSWMFLAFYSELRQKLLNETSFVSLAQLGARAFPEIGGEVVQTAILVLHRQSIKGHIPVFFDLTNEIEDEKARSLLANRKRFEGPIQSVFYDIPGAPVAYWVSPQVRDLFSRSEKMSDHLDARQGMATTDNVRFLRYWHEISFEKIQFGGANYHGKWFPYNKGGEYRKWGGGFTFVVDYERGGETLIELVRGKYPKISDPEFVIKNRKYYFRPGITWSDLGSKISARVVPEGFIFDTAGPTAFYDSETARVISLNLLNSSLMEKISAILNPGLHFTIGDFNNVPFLSGVDVSLAGEIAGAAVQLAEDDWNSFEVSWQFSGLSWLNFGSGGLCEGAFAGLTIERNAAIDKMRFIERQNNDLFLDGYNLRGEISADASADQITLALADREKDCQRLISYAIGCMMGRYSLDEPGLIYARAGNTDFDPSRYNKRFPADVDGIVPLTEESWFEDDAASRFREFVRAVWGTGNLDENMVWVADSLGTKGSESPDETVRRYLADKFFKDHLQTYKKRPIYWLFSSGKQGAFQALVYLHRYNEGTLARMRAEYVVPLISKMASRLEMLNQDVAAASSAAARTKLQKQIELLRKKQLELLAYDEKLRHYADMRITLDLDDGVKVNYAKFGDLVAESKAITGGSDE